MKKWPVVLIVIVILLLVGLPAGMGAWVKQSFDNEVARINALPAYQVTVDDYRQGWFSSDVELTIGIDPVAFGDPDDPEVQALLPEQVSLQAHIDHGPVLWSKSTLGLTQLQGGFNLEKNPRLAVFSERAGVSDLVALEAYVSLAGEGQAYLTSPEFEVVPRNADEAAIDFGGLQLVSHFNLAGASFDLEGGMPYLRVESDKAAFRISNLGLAASGARVDNTRVWVGQQEINLELLSLTAQNADDLEMSAMRFRTDINEAEPGLIGGTIEFYADEIRTPDSVLTGLESTLAIERFDVEAIDQYAGLMQSAGNQVGDPQVAQQIVDKVEQLILPKLLSSNPEIRWESLQFNLNDESFSGQAQVSFAPGAEAQADLISSGNWRLFVNAEAHLKASEPLTQQLMAGFMKNQLKVAVEQTGRPYTQQQIDQYADSQALVMLNMFTQQGYLQQTEQGYQVDLDMTDGTATINGQPLPLPQ